MDLKQINELDLLRAMLRAREGDRREAILFRQGKSWMQISSHGHEALLTLAHLLEKDDLLAPYYRSGHMCLGKGAAQYDLACDFLAKQRSSSAGRSVSVHFSSREWGIFPGLAPTASHCPAALGLAWAQKLQGTGHITLCTIGDGATREGAFYEAVAFAIQEQLPLIFLVEDNGYAISTATQSMQPFRLDIFSKNVFKRFNGRSVETVFDFASQAIAKARAGGGPSVLWAEVDRMDAHTVVEDQRKYRDPAILNSFVDPVEQFAQELIRQNLIDENQWQLMQEQVREEVKSVYTTAQDEPFASPKDIYTHLYAAPVSTYEELPAPVADAADGITMVGAVTRVLSGALSEFPNVVLFGQDIEDPKGGVFGFTSGLSTKFPQRVFNAPVAETTIVGAAVGMAAMGFKPVFEIQFIDFMAPAFDQLVNQVASLRWRTAGKWSCPMVLYAPYGAYLPAGGLWHSQSNEGWWTHIPGLRVAVPSTPEDVVGLFWTAIQDNDPSLILIPKHLMQKTLPYRAASPVAFGKSKTVRSGADVTLVAWGNCVELAIEASVVVERERSISCEVIDLRTLVPFDADAVRLSLQKTGRLVVVQEDSSTSSFGASIISSLVSDPKSFEYFISSPQLVSRGDIHIPYHPNLEYEVLPSTEDVVAAIYTTLEE